LRRVMLLSPVCDAHRVGGHGANLAEFGKLSQALFSISG
jgi:hypothetical protein